MLDLFKGQLSITDIKNMTYKEIGYLREMRIKRKSNTANYDESSVIASILAGQDPS